MKSIHLRVIVFFLVFFTVSSLDDAFAQRAPGAGEVFVTQRFSIDRRGVDIVKGSMKADDYYLYFDSLNPGGKMLRYKIQLADGACEIGGMGPQSPVKLCETAGAGEKAFASFHKNMVCDGKIIFSIPLEINKKRYHSVIASDWHLYVFSCQALFRGRAFPLYRAPLGSRPQGAFYYGNHIFVENARALMGFRVSDAITAGETNILAPNAVINTQGALLSSLSISEDSVNEFDCPSRYAVSGSMVYKKMILSKTENISAADKFVYLLMGPGDGNVNIYCMDYNFKFSKLSNFTGAIFDFSLLDASRPSFLISYSPDVFLKNKSDFKRWTFSPPSAIGLADKFAGSDEETSEALVLRSGKFREGSYNKLTADNGGEARVEIIGKAAGKQPAAKILQIHKNIINDKFGPAAALSSSASKPVAFFYDTAEKKFRVYDVAGNNEYDSFFYNFGNGVISGAKFSFDGRVVLFKVCHYAAGSTAPESTALYAYRTVNKSLTQIAALRFIGDFECIRHDSKYKVVLTYSRANDYCDSIGFLSLD